MKKMKEEKKRAKIKVIIQMIQLTVIELHWFHFFSSFQFLFMYKSFFYSKLEQDTKGPEAKADGTTPTSPRGALPASEPKKPGRRRSVKVEPPPVQQTDEERIAQGKRVLGARSKAKALAKAQAEAEAAAEAAARAALSAKRAAERRAQAQKRMEERKRQQLIAEELKKPTEDMCLTDHKVGLKI